MRTIVDIPDDQLRILAEQSRIESVSRSEIIRRAVMSYIEQHRPAGTDAFGLWKGRGIEGAAYQRSLRAEWPE